MSVCKQSNREKGRTACCIASALSQTPVAAAGKNVVQCVTVLAMVQAPVSDEESLHPVAPVFRTLVLPVPRERAFELFTHEAHRWWSPIAGASPTGTPWAALFLETTPGGRWYERDQDGNEHEWGRVTSVDPPHRVTVDWRFQGWAVQARAELELCFVPIDVARSRMTLEHRIDPHSCTDMSGARDVVTHAWRGLLSRYARACQKAANGQRTAG